MQLRCATPDDFAAMRAIYGQYMDTPVTFEYELPDEAGFAARMEKICATYPCLVAVVEGRVAAYCYAHCPWERAAYQWNAELSIYTDRLNLGRGFGTRLYAAELALLKLQHVRVALGCVTVPNAASEGLHAKFGFRRAAFFARSGYKNGTWHDVAWFDLALYDADEAGATPQALVPFPQLLATEAETVAAMLAY